ncbi:MAG TPA: hypothetical protein VKR58_00055 [Aquella sp.]|nr:hypothetical protein [Aquella sp.]
MKNFIKLNSLKLICPVFLVAYSGIVYSYPTDLVSNYQKYFYPSHKVRGEYFTLGTMTMDMRGNVFSDAKGVHLTIDKGSKPLLNTGHITSYDYETTEDLLDHDGHKGKIEAQLKFKCQGQEDNMYNCKRIWSAFWLWSAKTKAEIDIAEFMVDAKTGNFGYSNHIIHAAPNTQPYDLKKYPNDYYMRYVAPQNPNYEPYSATDHTTTYGLSWHCHDNYNSCDLDFLHDGQVTARKTINRYNSPYWQAAIIDGFKNGYQIVFTQHYFSENGGSFESQYDNFNSPSEMIIKSITINDEPVR